MLSTEELYSFELEFARGNYAGEPMAEFQLETYRNDYSTGRATIPAPSGTTDFRLRIIYRSSTQLFEAWYDDSGAGTNWKFMSSRGLNDVVPDGGANTEFIIAIMANNYYGPITEGQLWADDFRLVNTALDVPVITTHPVTQKVYEGNTVDMSAGATGPGLTYQWRKNGVNISGATASSYSISNVQANSTGNYTVVVSNSNGGVTSETAMLTVRPAIHGSDNFNSDLSQWVKIGSDEGLEGSMTITAVNGHASFLVQSSSTDEQQAVLIWNGRPLASADWSAEVRGRNAAPFSNAGDSQFGLGVADSRLLSTEELYGFDLNFTRGDHAGETEAQLQLETYVNDSSTRQATIPAPAGTTDIRLRIIYRSSSQLFEAWYDDSGAGTNWKFMRSFPLSEVVPDATSSTEFIILIGANNYYGPITEGQLWADDFRLVNTPLDVPVITTQPVQKSVYLDSPASLSVTATGQSLTYQWRKNGVNIPGATASQFSISSAQSSHQGNYSVVVSNSNGGVTSETITLTVERLNPVILRLPSARVIGHGKPLSSSILQGGSASVPGTFSFSIPSKIPEIGTFEETVKFTPSDLTRYVTIETPVSVTVVPLPVILSEPIATATAGSEFSYQINATNDATLYHAIGLPAGLWINRRTGVISGKTAFTGQKVVVLGASNMGGTRTAMLTLNVDPDPKNWTAVAGSYDGLLEHHSLAGSEDGAVYRGLVRVTMRGAGVFSGRLFYNQCTLAADGTSRVYTPVNRSFYGVLQANPADPLLFEKVVKLGAATARGSQELNINVSFKTLPATINVEVRDFVSPSAEESEWVSQALLGSPSTVKWPIAASHAGGDLNFTKAFRSYTLSATGSGPNSANDAYFLVKLGSNGRLTWASRTNGASGSGSTIWSIHSDGTIRTSIYEGRLITRASLLNSNSVLGGVEFVCDGESNNWSARVNSTALPSALERHYSYVSKSGYTLAEPQHQTGIVNLDFSNDYSACLEDTRPATAPLFLVGTPSAPRAFVLTAQDPLGPEDNPVYHRWSVSFASNGVNKATPLPDSLGMSSPKLVLNLNKYSGEISGSYNSSLTEKTLLRRIYGCVLLSPTDDTLRARGWVEAETGITPVTSGWTLDLSP